MPACRNVSIIGQDAALAGGKLVNYVGIEVVHALELFAHANGPVDGGALDIQHRLDLIEQVNRVADITIHFINEGQNGGVAQPAYVHQFDGAFFNTLGTVDDHQRRVHGGEGAVGIF